MTARGVKGRPEAESPGSSAGAPRGLPPPYRGTILVLRVVTAAVWLVFGLGFKVLGLVPRHRTIVATIVGEALAGPTTIAIGLAETATAAWILSGFRPRTCAAVQTLAIVAMNVMELTLARDYLLAPIPMLFANAAFLTAGWICALRAPARTKGS